MVKSCWLFIKSYRMNSLETLLSKFRPLKAIDPTISYHSYIPIDLSHNNKDLTEELLDNASDFENYIEEYLAKNKSQVAYGGYNELRNLYKKNSIFNEKDSEERNIHIGMDLWIKAGTPVLAALDGKVHSFGFNAGPGNYGPTIILEHTFESHTFYTLYGHLSLENIEEIEIGEEFKRGEKIGILGDPSVNGGYAPHLHFQIIKNIEDSFGDYPGVSSKSNLNYYLENCPDPNLLLKINAL